MLANSPSGNPSQGGDTLRNAALAYDRQQARLAEGVATDPFASVEPARFVWESDDPDAEIPCELLIDE